MTTWPQGVAFEHPSQARCRNRSATRLAGSARRSITKAVPQVASAPLGTPKALALGVSLILSALLTAAALRLPDEHWLAWISFLPLFVIVRSARPFAAALAGALWGGCFYLFCSAGATPALNTTDPAIAPSASLLALLILIPAVYLGLAARPARAIGYKLLTLALGWTLIEIVLHLHNPSVARQGLLTGSVGEGADLHWLVRLLGYVCTAFLVATVNASLVGILSGVRLSLPAYRSLAGSPHVVWHLASRVVLAIQSWTHRQAHPRAPPDRCCVTYA